MYDLGLERAQEIADSAARTLRDAGQWTVPVDVTAILKHYQIDHSFTSRLGDADAFFDLRRPPYTLQLAARRPDQNPIGYAHRVRFTQGHEIGHLKLHQEAELFFRESHKARRAAAAGGDGEHCRRENEADAFSASLLLPERFFTQDLSHLSAVGRDDWRRVLSEKYKVSLGALDRRVAWLRDGVVISGEVFTDSRRIDWAFPSAALEKAMPEVAKGV